MRPNNQTVLAGVKISGAGRPLVLLHSSMSSGKQWTKLVQQLKDNHQIINIDLLGYGDAPQPDRNTVFSLQYETRRIESILAELGVEQFDLVGHSYGGATALKFTYENPSRVNRLVVFEPVAFHLLAADNPARQDVVQLGNSMAEMSDFEAAESFLDYWNGQGYFASIPDFVRQPLLNRVYKGVLDFTALLGESYQLSDYANIVQPTLLLSGEKTRRSAQAVVHELSQHLPNSHMQVTPGGHMAPISHADTVNQYIVDFLD
ncbi:alpha/beta fold hydrolase [Neptunicella sp. SCSIO 80796]|uniref:alpha/beta fold hydrolase n=1 Tax=Neptunicella plasticusilytica TaxID=3117012 RepID=UPI003A4DC6D1